MMGMGARLVALAAAGAMLSGCEGKFSDLPTPAPVATSQSTAEVGQVNIDIVSINPWQDVKSRFESNYGLTGQAALGAVNKATSFENMAQIRSAAAGLGIEADANIISNEVVKNQQSTTSGDVTTTTSSTTTTSDQKQTTPSSAPTATPPTGSASATAYAAGTAPSLAPMLAYQAGDALFRYAAVLDGGLGRIAPCGYVPILVTFRVSIIPNKRNQPYDTYLDLSVVPGEYDRGVVDATPVATSAAEELDKAHHTPLLDPAGAADPMGCGYRVKDADLNIVSFSSDSLENAQNDAIAQQTKALILAAAIRAGTVAASASYQNLSEDLDHTLNLKPNSLLSVGRIGKNTMHIRLGANRFGTNQFETLPLEHNISIVLLVPYQTVYPAGNTPNSGAPKFTGEITAVGHYYFRDARTDSDASDPAQDTNPDWENARLDYLRKVAISEIKQYPSLAGSIADLRDCAAATPDTAEGGCAHLSEYAYNIPNTTVAEFENQVFPFTPPVRSSRPPTAETADSTTQARQAVVAIDLWQRLVSVSSRPGMTPRVSRHIPAPLESCPSTDSVILVKDDGTNAVASVTGADGYAGSHIRATLTLHGKNGTSKTLAGSFDVPNADIGDLSFGSFASMFSKSDVKSGEFQFADRSNGYCPDYDKYYAVAYSQKGGAVATTGAGAAPKPKTGVSGYPSQLTEAGGKANVAFAIKLEDVKADAVDVSFSGVGQLDAIGSATPTAGVVTLTASGTYSAQLENLAPGKPVTLNFQFKAGGKPLAKAKTSVVLPITKG